MILIGGIGLPWSKQERRQTSGEYILPARCISAEIIRTVRSQLRIMLPDGFVARTGAS